MFNQGDRAVVVNFCFALRNESTEDAGGGVVVFSLFANFVQLSLEFSDAACLFVTRPFSAFLFLSDRIQLFFGPSSFASRLE